MDESKHMRYTGVSNARILGNLEALGRAHGNIWIRMPVIPGVNDAPADVEAVARFAASIPGVRRVNLLPHHETGVQKLLRMGRPDRLGKLAPPSAERMVAAAETFRALGLDTRIGG
jgi:pyruvate formate lyase activating enzyme